MIEITLEEILNEELLAETMEMVLKKKYKSEFEKSKIFEFKEYWKINKNKIIDPIYKGEYKADTVYQREILSKKGKKRCIAELGLVDKIISKRILELVSENIDQLLSQRCYAYKKGIGTLDIVGFAAEKIENGFIWSTELDIQDFFENISHERLIRKLTTMFSDTRIVTLLTGYMRVTIDNGNETYIKTKGLVQGMPLSPILSNVFLMDIDKQLEEMYEGYCRYGDDIRIYCTKKEEANDALITAKRLLLEEELLINSKKEGVFKAIARPHFGYELLEKDGKVLIQKKQTGQHNIYNIWQSSCVKDYERNYHIVNNGIITKKDFTLLFENPDGKYYIPVETIDSLNIYSDVIFSSNFFDIANNEKMIINFIDKFGNCIGKFIPAMTKRNIKIETAQVNLLNNIDEHINLARTFQYANVFNIRAALRYYERRGYDLAIKEAVDYISVLLDKIKVSKSMDALMIYEAQARQRYYQCFNYIMTADDFTFTTRTRRPPQDAINAMM